MIFQIESFTYIWISNNNDVSQELLEESSVIVDTCDGPAVARDNVHQSVDADGRGGHRVQQSCILDAALQHVDRRRDRQDVGRVRDVHGGRLETIVRRISNDRLRYDTEKSAQTHILGGYRSTRPARRKDRVGRDNAELWQWLHVRRVELRVRVRMHC